MCPFEMPDGEQRVQRLRSVLHVLYLIFNEGYSRSTDTDLYRTARSSEAIRLAPDRTRWDQAQITEGVALVVDAMAQGSVGEYQLQAAIAGVHDEATSVEATDWPQILALSGLLERMSRNPMVALNRAIAAAMVHGPTVGLALLQSLDERLDAHWRLDAVRAHFHEIAGDTETAAAHYRAAAARTTSTPERDSMISQAAWVSAR